MRHSKFSLMYIASDFFKDNMHSSTSLPFDIDDVYRIVGSIKVLVNGLPEAICLLKRPDSYGSTRTTIKMYVKEIKDV